jgi:hypothetical protein
VRVVRIFILRLLVDPAEPEALRGTLQSLPEGKPHPFTDEQKMVRVLRWMMRSALVQEGKAHQKESADEGEE